MWQFGPMLGQRDNNNKRARCTLSVTPKAAQRAANESQRYRK